MLEKLIKNLEKNYNYKMKELKGNDIKQYKANYSYISIEEIKKLYNVILEEITQVVEVEKIKKYLNIKGLELKTLLPKLKNKKVLGIEFCLSNTRYFSVIPLDRNFEKFIVYIEFGLIVNQEKKDFISFDLMLKDIKKYIKETVGYGYFEEYENQNEKNYLESLKKYDLHRTYEELGDKKRSIENLIESDLFLEKINLEKINNNNKISNIYYLKSMIEMTRAITFDIDCIWFGDKFIDKSIEYNPKNINTLTYIIQSFDFISISKYILRESENGTERMKREIERLNICIEGLEYEDIENNIEYLLNNQIIKFIEPTMRAINNKELNIGLIKLYENLLNKINTNDIRLIKILMILYSIEEAYYFSGYMLYNNQVKKYPNTEVLYLYEIGRICLELKKFDEAEKYFRKLEKYENKNNYYIKEKDPIQRNRTKLYIALSCLAQKKLDEAEKLFKEVEEEVPGNTIYHNLGRLYFEKKEYEKSKSYFEKALFISKDETSYKAYADALYFNKNYKDAIEYYKKTIAFIENENPVFLYNETGKTNEKMLSYKTENTDIDIKKETYENIIYSYIELEDYINAKVYNEIASKEFKNDNIFEKMERTLNKLISYDKNEFNLKKQYEDVCRNLEKEKLLAREQSGKIKKWALDLIKLQNNNIDSEISEEEFNKFDKNIEKIIKMMKEEKSNIKNNELFYNIEKEFKEKYNNLSYKALKFLTTGEYLYRVNKDEFIDYAPIMIEYCKVIELELNEYLIKKGIIKEKKMLGQINRILKDLNIVEISRFLDDIVLSRNASAHTGRIKKEDVEHIRNIILDKGFLKLIISE